MRERRAVAFADEVEHRQPKKDEHSAEEGTFQVAGVAPDEDRGGAEDEDGGEHRISPDAIGTRKVWTATAIEEDRGCREHIEKPLGENRKLEVLLELRKKEQQDRRE